MKKFVVIILSFLFLFIAFKDVATYIYYFSNQKYIANNLCVNRFTPELMCYGKCVLSKQLLKNQDSNDGIPLKRVIEKVDVKYISSSVLILTETSDLKEKARLFFPKNFYHLLHFSKIFHPPQIAYSFYKLF